MTTRLTCKWMLFCLLAYSVVGSGCTSRYTVAANSLAREVRGASWSLEEPEDFRVEVTFHDEEREPVEAWYPLEVEIDENDHLHLNGRSARAGARLELDIDLNAIASIEVVQPRTRPSGRQDWQRWVGGGLSLVLSVLGAVAFGWLIPMASF